MSTLASADPTAPELQARGEDLAKQGHFTEAIDAFKQADKIEPTATHACLIALAYTRRELWPQAEVWLALCQVRANKKDPLPDWAAAEQDQINERLAAANVAPVQIEVQPPDANAKLTVSDFAPDEQFSPRTIHLAPGLHTIKATAPGYQDAEKQIEIKDKGTRVIVLTLQKPGSGQPLPAGPSAAPVHSKVPLYVMAAGAGLGVVGVGLHLFYYKPKLDTLTKYSKTGSMPDIGMYNNAVGPWETARNVTIGFYAAGVVTLGVGVVLKYTVYKNHEEAPAVGFVPTQGGGMVSLGFTR